MYNMYNMYNIYNPCETIQDNSLVKHPLYILDPLSVIVKLAILSNKPVGTKICIQHNMIFLQEPGPFQAFCRYLYKTNKTDLQFLYNPIQIACSTFLSQTYVKTNPKMIELFICAQKGMSKLIDTYKSSSIIRLCLNYYMTLISNYIDKIYNTTLFRKDTMSLYYTENIVTLLNGQWTPDKIKVVLDIIEFLVKEDKMANNNVKSLENIMIPIDEETKRLLAN